MQNQAYEFTKLVKCWRSMPRGNGTAPKKATFSPAKLPSLVPFMFLIERKISGGLLVRLLGSELEKKLDIMSGDFAHNAASCNRTNRQLNNQMNSLMNSGPTARSSMRLFDAMMLGSWSSYESFMQSCTAHMCGGHLHRRIHSNDGLLYEIESMHVPLADDAGKPRFMLGVMIKRLCGPSVMSEVGAIPSTADLKFGYIDLCGSLPPASKHTQPGGAPFSAFASLCAETPPGEIQLMPTVGPGQGLREDGLPHIN